ncbi:hypothetical protein KBD34_00155 [Patescibacteria group bacterium]|nr:hypothetical protein [Patescibacteria group bacterium]
MSERLPLALFEEEQRLDRAVQILTDKIDPLGDEQRLIFGPFTSDGVVTNLGVEKLANYLLPEGIYPSESAVRADAEKIAKRYIQRTGYHMNG